MIEEVFFQKRDFIIHYIPKIVLHIILLSFFVSFPVTAKNNQTGSKKTVTTLPSKKSVTTSPSKKPVTTSSSKKTETATLAGGCFWCIESDLEPLPGVIEVISGYTGGHKPNPAYKEVSAGTTGHQEAVQVIFNPKQISYSEILNVFWKKINPLDKEGQFVDRGFQYSSGIFYHSERQKQLALQSKTELEARGPFKGKKIVTPIKPFTIFYKAEEYHQDYYKNNPLRYKFYRYRSGRDQFLEKTWSHFKDFHLFPQKITPKNPPSVPDSKQKTKATAEKKSIQNEKQKTKLNPQNTSIPEQSLSGKDKSQVSSEINTSPKTTAVNTNNQQKPSKEELKKRLTPLQYKVTQEEGTEKPFDNEYWNNKKEGIYVDVVSGEPLFSSLDKYDSGTGWPSFTKPLVPESIVTKTDFKLLYPRTEVRSKKWDSHLGHVFKDDPPPGGLRYCINSAALRFIAKDKLKEEGYEQFIPLFQNSSEK